MTLGHVGEHRSPGDPQSDCNQYYSRHTGDGVNFLFADGHVAFLKSTMPYPEYFALGTRGGGEVISDDF